MVVKTGIDLDQKIDENIVLSKKKVRKKKKSTKRSATFLKIATFIYHHIFRNQLLHLTTDLRNKREC